MALVLLAASGLLACDEWFTTHFVEVPVSGLPRCPTGVMPTRPVIVEMTSGDHTVREYFTGADATPSVSLPEGERQWDARFGLCQPSEPRQPSYACGQPQWYAERTLTLDPASPGARVVVPAPPETGCGPGPRPR